jgi:agmatinase
MADETSFDPNGIGLLNNNIFGLPFTDQNAELILLPVPWEATVSYRTGTALGPDIIFDASLQVDLYDADLPNMWQKGYYMLPSADTIIELNDELREKAEVLLDAMAAGAVVEEDKELLQLQVEVNAGCAAMCDWVFENTMELLNSGKKVGLVGGDHSTPFGYLQALAEFHDDFGILQIDAHADLREAYEGFEYSHASIMFNVLNDIPEVTKLVQVGIRDYCDDELDIIQNNPERIATFFDRDIKTHLYEGGTWKQMCEQIINALPEKVYISFDIDGLDPKLCPSTGTPVPGGFELEQVFYLFRLLKASGRTIIGFDLNEVSGPEENEEGIDAITGARVLYKLCNYLVA